MSQLNTLLELVVLLKMLGGHARQLFVVSRRSSVDSLLEAVDAIVNGLEVDRSLTRTLALPDLLLEVADHDGDLLKLLGLLVLITQLFDISREVSLHLNQLLQEHLHGIHLDLGCLMPLFASGIRLCVRILCNLQEHLIFLLELLAHVGEARLYSNGQVSYALADLDNLLLDLVSVKSLRDFSQLLLAKQEVLVDAGEATLNIFLLFDVLLVETLDKRPVLANSSLQLVKVVAEVDLELGSLGWAVYDQLEVLR